MKEMHPRDEWLQQWVEKTLPPQKHQDVQAHLQQCAVCRQRVDTYRLLFDGFSIEKKFNLSPAFQELVLSRARLLQRRQRRIQLLGRLSGYGVGGTVFALAAVYFIDPEIGVEQISSSVSSQLGFYGQIFTSFRDLLLQLNLDWLHVVAALAAFGFIAFIDQACLRGRARFFIL